MAAWFTPLLPFIPEAIKLTSPLFTRSRAQDKGPEVLDTQIAELQSAATQNAEATKALAAEMQKTIDALKVGADALAKELRAARLLSVVAVTAAVLAFALAAFALGMAR